MEPAVYIQSPESSYAQFYNPWAVEDRFSPAMMKTVTATSGTYRIHGRLIEVRQYPRISRRGGPWPGHGASPGPRPILQPKPHRYVLPPAQTDRILHDWEMEPIEMLKSPVSVQSEDGPRVSVINVFEGEAEDAHQASSDPFAFLIQPEDEVRSEEEENGKSASRLAAAVRARVIEARERCLVAGLGLKRRWKALLDQ